MSGVIDSSAILAFLLDEPGSALAESALLNGHVSSVIASETAAKLIDLGHSLDEAWDVIAQMGLTIHPFDAEAARLSSGLRAASRRAGLSFAERACLALGLKLAMPVHTADRAWAQAGSGAEVRLIR